MVAPAVESDRRGAGFRLLRQGSAGIWVFTSAGIWVFFYTHWQPTLPTLATWLEHSLSDTLVAFALRDL